MGIHKSRTTAYHPECDGQVERQNRTLMKMPAAFVSVHKDDRDGCVNIVVYAHNTVGRELTEYSLKEVGFHSTPKVFVLDLDVPLKILSVSQNAVSSLGTLRKNKQLAQDNLHKK